MNRMKFLTFAILVIVANVFAESGAKGWSEIIKVRIGPDSNACGIVLPKPLKSLPLIVWLHGGMRSQNETKGWEAQSAILPFLKPGSYFVCSPSGYAGADWLTPEGMAHIDALIDYMEHHYPIRKDKLIFVAVSDGCLGAIRYASEGKRNPLKYVLFSSCPPLAVDPGAILSQPVYTKTRWDIFQGGRDRLFPSDQIFPLLQEWARVNPRVKLHLYPEGEHDFSWYKENAGLEIRKLF